MRLTELLLEGSKTSVRRLIAMASIAGISNAALLAVINKAADLLGEQKSQSLMVVLFVGFILTYIYAQRYVLLTTTVDVEDLVHRFRERLIRLLSSCELSEVEHMGRGRLFSAISSDTQTISQATNALVMGAQSGVLIVCACVYMATISLTSLLFSAFFLTLAAQLYLRKMKGVGSILHQSSVAENELHDMVSGLLEGFKEVKLSSRRATAVLSEVVEVSARTAERRAAAQQAMGINFIFAQVAFLLLLGSLVFLTPMLVPSYSEGVMKSMTAVIFLIGPISSLVATVPQVAVANAAAENLYSLEQLLRSHARKQTGDAEAKSNSTVLPSTFKHLQLRQVEFAHGSGEGAFYVGPIDFQVNAGQTIFITGGNGSGKSTLIKLLTGLYAPKSGELYVNGLPVTADNAQAFRDCFCAVFSDFYLFKKLYGITPPAHEVLEQWLDEMEISGKTDVAGNSFTNIDLSTGQKKRLAFISAMLEDKPIIILDEWAADQDPLFRIKFYDVLLARLKAAGKTVIAVTHDDRFFHVADRRLHMEDGKFRDLSEI